LYFNILLDSGSATELFSELNSADPLKFKAQKKYTDQIKTAQEKTQQKDAVICYTGSLNGDGIVLAVMNFGFIGGSMGSVVGEKYPVPLIMPAIINCR